MGVAGSVMTAAGFTGRKDVGDPDAGGGALQPRGCIAAAMTVITLVVVDADVSLLTACNMGHACTMSTACTLQPLTRLLLLQVRPLAFQTFHTAVIPF